ncbi:MAG: GNAT family N-acetyltransferase [Nitrososphaerales archaeon]
MAGSRDALADLRLALGSGEEMVVGPASEHDLVPLFEMFSDVVERKEGYPHAPPLTPEVFDSVWSGPRTTVICARLDQGGLAGAYYLRPNFPGRAAHIANAGYMVARVERGRGIGKLLVEDSIRRAPALGFDAVQFNLVFESNPARAMYESLGWREIGRVPRAVEGEDAIVYWRAVG